MYVLILSLSKDGNDILSSHFALMTLKELEGFQARLAFPEGFAGCRAEGADLGDRL